MTILKIKENIHRLVDEIEDNQILQAVYMILEQNNQLQKPIWDELSEGEKKTIQEALNQSEKGEGIPHAQVVAKLQQKYGFPK